MQMHTWGLVQACLRKGDGGLKDEHSSVTLIAALVDACADGGRPALGFEGAQQAAPALMPQQVADVVIWLGPVLLEERGQLEGQREAVALPHGWHHMHAPALHGRLSSRCLQDTQPLQG